MAMPSGKPQSQNCAYYEPMSCIAGDNGMRHPLIIAVLLMATAACTSPDRARRAGSPVAPTAATTAAAMLISSGGNLGPMDVAFPSRADAFQFRNELETKYQTGLNRGASLTFVDREGDVVWTQEYIR